MLFSVKMSIIVWLKSALNKTFKNKFIKESFSPLTHSLLRSITDIVRVKTARETFYAYSTLKQRGAWCRLTTAKNSKVDSLSFFLHIHFCHKNYKVEAVSLSLSNYVFKITIFWVGLCEIWGNFVKICYFVNNCVIILLHICDTYNFDYLPCLPHTTFRFYSIDKLRYSVDYRFHFQILHFTSKITYSDRYLKFKEASTRRFFFLSFFFFFARLMAQIIIILL